ncbi:MAG: hypothetical protein JW894_04370 [Bacteroidales bacterium]|nr:hypothetical protein [Bacteroidales bacterium]
MNTSHSFIIFLFINSFLYFVIGQELKFEYLTPDDGLSQATVVSIIQDQQGFMWFGTRNGLNKYDGYIFTHYYHDANDPASLSDNSAGVLFIDHKGNLWVGTDAGLSLYNRELDNFINFIHDESVSTSISGPRVGTIYEDSKNRLWVGTHGFGINILDSDNNTFRHFRYKEDDSSGISGDNIRGIIEDKYGTIWLTTQDHGLNRFNEKNLTFTHFSHDPDNPASIASNTLYTITKDNNGTIWLGTLGEGLCRMNVDTEGKIFFSGFKPETNDIRRLKILSLLFNEANGIWIGTENGGLDYFNIIDESYINYQFKENYPNTLNNNSVHSIYIDRTDNLWIGTYAGGINVVKHNKKKFSTYRKIPGNENSISYNAVTSFLEDKQGRIWIGTDGGGVNLWDRNKDKMIHYNSNNSSLMSDAVLAVCEDKNGNIWIGGWECALNKYNPETGIITTYTQQKHGIPNNNIFDMILARDGFLWMTFGGIGFARYDIDQNKFNVYSAENCDLPDPWIHDIAENYDGRILLGHAKGFSIFNSTDKSIINYTGEYHDSNVLIQKAVNVILVATDSIIWIGTTNSLDKLDMKTGKFESYYKENGLPNNNICGLVEDMNSHIWISTANGICDYNPKKNTFKSYSQSDGLQGSSYIRNSKYRTKKGEVAFGGTNGFNIFNPDSLIENPNLPPVVITDFTIFNKPVKIGNSSSPLSKSITVTDKITLDYKQSVITFHFAALEYTAPDENQYAYILEGFEKEWNYVGTKRTATYTNLDAGNYTFRVKASNNDGIWNETGTSVQIVVKPPYWETWWFRTGIVVATLFIIFSYFILRIRSVRKNNIILEEQVAKRTHELSIKNELLSKQKNELDEINAALEERQEKVEEQAEELLAQKEELQAINKELHKANATKDKFFSIIAHDIKNPFTTVLGFLELLNINLRNWSDDKKEHTVKTLLDTTKNVYDLLENLLQWSRSQRGVIEFNTQNINLSNLISYVTDLLKNSADAKNISIENRIKDQDIEAYGDERMLNTILRNLIGNAVKFTHKGGRVIIQAARDKAFLTVSVSDNGVGMNPDQLSKIFKIDSHLTTQGTNNEGGTGLGLILCKEFVNKHGGKIWVESEPGKGSTFYFSLPTYHKD